MATSTEGLGMTEAVHMDILAALHAHDEKPLACRIAALEGALAVLRGDERAEREFAADQELAALRAEIAMGHASASDYTRDPWEERIKEFLAVKGGVEALDLEDIFVPVFGDRRTRAVRAQDRKRISGIMQRLGWHWLFYPGTYNKCFMRSPRAEGAAT